LSDAPYATVEHLGIGAAVARELSSQSALNGLRRVALAKESTSERLQTRLAEGVIVASVYLPAIGHYYKEKSEQSDLMSCHAAQVVHSASDCEDGDGSVVTHRSAAEPFEFAV
jgi:hypothetical protein